MAHWLIEKGLKVNVENKFAQTPLFYASEVGSVNIIHRFMREPEMRLDHQDTFRDTALHFAARDGRMEVCEYLLKRNRRLIKLKN